MKKQRLLFLLVALATTCLFLAGCGDDNDSGGGGTAPPSGTDTGKFDYTLLISEWSNASREDVWTISVMPTDSTATITSLDVSIDGQTIGMSPDGTHFMWSGEYAGFEHGGTSSIAATINGSAYSEDIKICHMADVSFPETWDMTQTLELHWTLDGNSMWQTLDGDADWYGSGNEHGHAWAEMSVSTGARSVTIPANWLGIPSGEAPDVFLGICQLNWAANNRFLAMSSAVASDSCMTQNSLAQARDRAARRTVSRVLDLLGN